MPREADPCSPRERNREAAQRPSTSSPAQLPAQNGQDPAVTAGPQKHTYPRKETLLPSGNNGKPKRSTTKVFDVPGGPDGSLRRGHSESAKASLNGFYRFKYVLASKGYTHSFGFHPHSLSAIISACLRPREVVSAQRVRWAGSASNHCQRCPSGVVFCGWFSAPTLPHPCDGRCGWE